jgi:hypothetical protein
MQPGISTQSPYRIKSNDFGMESSHDALQLVSRKNGDVSSPQYPEQEIAHDKTPHSLAEEMRGSAVRCSTS